MKACENLDAKYAVPANDTSIIIRADQAPSHLLKNERFGISKINVDGQWHEYKKVVLQRREFWVRTIPGPVEVVCLGITEKHQICTSWGEITDMDETNQRRLRSDGKCPPCPAGNAQAKPKVEDRDIPATECGDGWEKVFATNSCHKLLDGQAFWKAEKECVNLGGHLTSIKSSDEQLVMLGKQKRWSPGNAIWIGGYNMQINGRVDFWWLDSPGQNMTYTNYGPAEPAADLFCLLFGPGGNWSSALCSEVHQAFCQRPLGPPKVLDDPKCEDGWIPCKETQRCYKADRATMDFVSARESCLQQDADLTTVHSYWENEVIIEAAAAAGADKAWMGSRKENHKWGWVNGEPYDFEVNHGLDPVRFNGACLIVFGAVDVNSTAWLHRNDDVDCTNQLKHLQEHS
ncbi:unnamed protein product, partial [Mesorhabditis spiculigera]